MDSGDEQKINEQRIKILKQGIAILVLCVFIVMLLAALFYILRKNGSGLIENASQAVADAVIGEEGETFTLSEATIRKVFESSELSTADYTYNAVARDRKSVV